MKTITMPVSFHSLKVAVIRVFYDSGHLALETHAGAKCGRN